MPLIYRQPANFAGLVTFLDRCAIVMTLLDTTAGADVGAARGSLDSCEDPPLAGDTGKLMGASV